MTWPPACRAGCRMGCRCWRNSSRRRGIVPSSTPTTGRGRPRQAEGAFATGARAQAGPQRPGDHRRARLHPEPPARTLRAGGRATHQSAPGGRVRRTDLDDLIPSGRGDFSLPWVGAMQQRPCGRCEVGAQSGKVRGSPKRASTLLSKRVMALIRRPARVSTSSPFAWRRVAWGSRTYMPNAGWPLARVATSR